MSNVTYFKCWVFFWYLCSLNEVYVACSSLGTLNSNCLWKCKLMWILLSVAFSTSPIIFGDNVSQYHLSFHVKISCYCSRSENNSFACFFPPQLAFFPPTSSTTNWIMIPQENVYVFSVLVLRGMNEDAIRMSKLFFFSKNVSEIHLKTFSNMFESIKPLWNES